jgi:hypothetical protein
VGSRYSFHLFRNGKKIEMKFYNKHKRLTYWIYRYLYNEKGLEVGVDNFYRGFHIRKEIILYDENDQMTERQVLLHKEVFKDFKPNMNLNPQWWY